MYVNAMPVLGMTGNQLNQLLHSTWCGLVVHYSVLIQLHKEEKLLKNKPSPFPHIVPSLVQIYLTWDLSFVAFRRSVLFYIY